MLPFTVHLEKIIEDCFPNLRSDNNPNEGKRAFGLVWAVFASKKVYFNKEVINASWRELSIALANIYNAWYKLEFTTDAFFNILSPDKAVGENAEYDEVLLRIYKHAKCERITIVQPGQSISSRDDRYLFSEVDIVTGEQRFYEELFSNGKSTGEVNELSGKEFETLSYAKR